MAIVAGRSERWRLFFTHFLLIALIAITIFPFLVVVSMSFRSGNFANGSLWPSHPSLEHWKLALGMSYVDSIGRTIEPPFPVMQWLWNSVKIGAGSAFLVVFSSVTCAYAFARLKFRGRRLILGFFLVFQMFPMVLSLVAVYTVLDLIGAYGASWLGLNSHGGLMLVYMGGTAMHIWTLKGYFATIPESIEEAARVDGATMFQVLRLILIPMSLPMLATVYVIAFIWTITEYPVASIVLQTEDQLTLAVGSQYYMQINYYMWGDFAAAAVLTGVPIAVLFLIAQKALSYGLAGASKQ
jgi:maltose/maltodextrin transport system permease protein